ncbi:hypothetical protein CRUP_001944 [Coryphaenoides rupestris]|nr:hypothetical protein CRUP_001944 [Coryphaenoides rupestris]
MAPGGMQITGVDAASLLRLYLNYDLLEEAAELVLEYVDALLGKGHQYFGIEIITNPNEGLLQIITYPNEGLLQIITYPNMPLSATAPLVWLPYTAIDQLLQALGESQINTSIYNKLQEKLDHYHRLLDQTTRRRILAQ